MKYLTTEQIAKRWNISTRRVQYLLNNNRISGAQLFNNVWMIPENSSKPIDARTKKAKENINDDTNVFRFPEFEDRNIKSINPALSNVEKLIKEVKEDYHACNFEKAESGLEKLLTANANKYNHIYILYMACYVYHMLNKPREFFDNYKKLSIEISKNFDKRNELAYLIHEVNATIGIDKYFIDDFSIDINYKYDESFKPHLCALCMIAFSSKNNENISVNDLIPYEYMCSSIEDSEAYVEIQNMHLYLGVEYAKLLKLEEMKYHYTKAFEIAQKYQLYYSPASMYYYYSRSFDAALKDFSSEFVNKIKTLSKDIDNRYKKFMTASSLSTIYSELDGNEYFYMLCAIKGFSNKEVASLLKKSESNVANKYSSMYQKFGLHNKNELIEHYNKLVRTTIDK